jgi:hypothetical protein
LTFAGAQLAWAIVLAGVLASLAFVVAGIIVVARRAMALKKRLVSYRDVPAFSRILVANRTIVRALPAVANAPEFLLRLQVAMRDIADARTRLAVSAKTASEVVRRAFTRAPVATPSKAARIPEN